MSTRDDEILTLIRDLARLARDVRKSCLSGKEKDWHLKVCEIEVKASEMIGGKPKLERL